MPSAQPLPVRTPKKLTVRVASSSDKALRTFTAAVGKPARKKIR